MDKTVVIVLIVAVVVILAVVLMNRPQQQLAPIQPVAQQPANFWSSLGDIAGILGALGVGQGGNNGDEVIIAGGEDFTGGDTYARVVNADSYLQVPSQQVAATRGFDYLQEAVEDDSMEFNTL